MFHLTDVTVVTVLLLIAAPGLATDIYPPPDGSFTIAVLPDTQEYTWVDERHEIFLSQTRWIAENHERQKIAFVLHEGDVTQHNNEPQWTLAREAFQMLDDAGVPYVITLGNHDYGTTNFSVKDSTDTPFNEPRFFGPGSPYALQPTVGAFMEEGRADNSFHTFRAGDRDWIVLALEWQPPAPVIAWANDVLAEHPDHTAILLTHEYLFSASQPNPASRTGPGSILWRDLVSEHNFAFVFCGHVFGSGRVTSVGRSGQVVHQMLANYQGMTQGGNGYLRLIQILPDGRTVRVRTPSTYTGEMMRTRDDHFDLVLCEPAGEGVARVPRECHPDCNENGSPDASDIASGLSTDANRNGYPDECDVHAEFTVTPAEGEAPLEVRLDAGASATQAGHTLVSYDWDLGDGTAAHGRTVTHTYSRAGPKRITLVVRDDRESFDGASQEIDVYFPSGDVSPWASEDIGDVGFPGGARFESGCLSLFAGRGSLLSSADRCHFVSRDIGGDHTLTARISAAHVEGLGTATLGLMLRESLDPEAPRVALLFRNGTVQLSTRSVARDRANRVASQSRELPDIWLRLERRGRQVLGATSADGQSWEELPPVDLDLGDAPLVGIAAYTSSSRATVTSVVCDMELNERELRRFSRGDGNGDGTLDITDVSHSLGWLFSGGVTVPCLAALNANGDDAVNISDPLTVLNYLFAGGPPLAPPFPGCGSANDLGCEEPPAHCR